MADEVNPTAPKPEDKATLETRVQALCDRLDYLMGLAMDAESIDEDEAREMKELHAELDKIKAEMKSAAKPAEEVKPEAKSAEEVKPEAKPAPESERRERHHHLI